MALVFTIYNTEIDQQYIKRYPISKSSFKMNDQDIIAATMDIELDNTEENVFSDLYSSGLFFGTDWYNGDVTIYDDEQNIYTWVGRLKNIKESWNDNTIICQSTNYIRDLADTTCNYTSTGNVTPAEHIYNILTDSAMLDISDDYINYRGFSDAINIQDSYTAYVNMRFTKEKNKKCLAVVKELCRMCQMNIYTDANNKISLYQYAEWSGVLGYNIKDRDVLEKTYEHEYDTKNIYNDIVIYYENGAGTLSYTTSDSTSQSTFGLRQFLVPDQNVDAATSANNNILFKTLIGAQWAGDLALSRYATIKKKMKVELVGDFKFLELGDQIDLSFGPFIREPCQITSFEHDRNKEKIKIESEFLNTPNEVYSRDTEPPGQVEIISAEAGTNSVSLTWTASAETDHVGYTLYFTVTPGEWESEYCNLGQSPIDIKNPSTDDGYNILTIYELNAGSVYYFKITSYDTSFNESDDSNIMSATPS